MRIKISEKINKILTTAAVTASAVCFLSSCNNDGTLFHSYNPVDDACWEKSDEMYFDIAPGYSGMCDGFVLLRINDKYPYTNLSVNVETSLNGIKKVRRVDFDVSPENRSGIRHDTYSMPAGKIEIEKNDTLRVRIVHNMKRNVLQGITDVGVKVIRSR